jgi:hypothetical protein
VDPFGNRTEALAQGCIEGCHLGPDEAIRFFTVPDSLTGTPRAGSGAPPRCGCKAQAAPRTSATIWVVSESDLGARVLKTAVDEDGNERHTARVVATLELRRAAWDKPKW